jgi:ankyrin repeat protein
MTVHQLAIFAARSGDLALLAQIAEEGADLNYQDPKHGSALSAAIHAAKVETVQFLIEHGVNVNVKYSDSLGPLEQALHNPNPNIVYLLVCAGAKLTRTSRPHYRNRLTECLRSIKTDERKDA